VLGFIPEIYSNREIQLSMAGTGDPWSYFKTSSKLTIRALYDGYSLDEIQELFQVSKEELQEKINLLVDANLLQIMEGKINSTFLIVNKEETERTYYYAKEFGKMLADELVNYWEEIESDYLKLDISKKCSLTELSLVLVGSKIMDIALLDVLAKDGTLLQPAPKRSNPKRPDAQYYFYMIEGKQEYLGKYGEESMDLPKENWSFVTFGQNMVNGKQNEPRNRIEEKCDILRKKGEIKEPENFAKALNSPILSREDSIEWLKTAEKIARRLLVKVKEKEDELREFYNKLKISNYSNNSLGEFICWYIHLAYSWAIDFLVEKEIIHMPDSKFNILVIYSEGSHGLLVK